MDWKNPDYDLIFRTRMNALKLLRADPSVLPDLRDHYRAHPADFISDWGVTFDPRNPERNLPALIPFVLFDKQREWVDWVIGHWRDQTPGLCEKSRDIGISWLSTSLACALCLFHEGVAVGFGSRVVDLVDKIGTMKPLLPKARMFMEHLPEEFRGGWQAWRDAPYMRLNFPETGSLIMGEGGDQIGRGDRASMYFVDEAAYLERPDLVEHSLSQTTNCRIDMSSVRPNTVFARKRHEGKVDVFVFDWRDDPRKDEEWYRLLSEDAVNGGKGLDPVTIAQEVDRDYSAAVSGIVIPGAWVRSCVGALEKLGIAPSGARQLALDVADEGVDKNALVGTTGVQVDYLEEFSGKGGDLFSTTTRAFEVCDERGYPGFRYDADGLGAGVRGDARVINDARRGNNLPQRVAEGFRGSEAVYDPDGIVEGTVGREGDKGRTNKDYFWNRKAQAWWSVRRRAQKTHRWVVDGVRCEPGDILSIDKACALWPKLVTELSQATYAIKPNGKLLIDKTPPNTKSPNLADGVVMRYAPHTPPPLHVTQAVLRQVRAFRRRR